MNRRVFPTFLVIALTGGCAVPIAHEVCQPIPVQNERARAFVREIHRGAKGGVIAIEITNLSEAFLFEAAGSKVDIKNEDGEPVKSLRLGEFEFLVDRHGPIAMGFEHWSRFDMPVTLDPLGVQVNLRKDEVGLLYVAFGEDARPGKLTLDLTQALRWKNSLGRPIVAEKPLLLVVDLPEAPQSKMPTKDAWRNIHFGVGISSDNFNL